MNQNNNKIRTISLMVLMGIIYQNGKVYADWYVDGKAAVNLDVPLNSPRGEMANSMSSDGLELYISSSRVGVLGGPGTIGGGKFDWDLWVTRRASTTEPWGPLGNLGAPINSPRWDETVAIAPNGLEMYFCSFRARPPSGYVGYDIWVSRRASKDDPWGEPEMPASLAGEFNHDTWETSPWITSDGLELYFASWGRDSRGSDDLYVARRESIDAPWGPAENLGSPINAPGSQNFPSVSTDGLALFYSEYFNTSPNGPRPDDIYVTTRSSRHEPWGDPVKLELDVQGVFIYAPRVFRDSSTLYFSSTRDGALGGRWGDIYSAPILPMVDFTGDGLVDIKDLVALIAHWGQDDKVYDIGPNAWGDGVVDEADLQVLMRHYGQSLDPSLLAHWKLDEHRGLTASDSGVFQGSAEQATVFGGPVWRPEDGAVGGAILLDGVDDYLETPFILDPKSGPFSVFVWVKGGMPGQAILSQKGVSNWLMIDPDQGTLSTDFKIATGHVFPYASDVGVTDGHWHRVGIVWDGTTRILYVDDVEVLREVGVSFLPSENGLHIGAGSDLAAGSFWSGMIDDVRFYDRAVLP